MFSIEYLSSQFLNCFVSAIIVIIFSTKLNFIALLLKHYYAFLFVTTQLTQYNILAISQT